MRLCTGCQRREAEQRADGKGYRKCAPCRARNNRAARAYYARNFAMEQEPTRKRTLKLLSTFVMSSRDLSCALDISVLHASNLLRQLWQQGRCERWPYVGHSYRYRLRDL